MADCGDLEKLPPELRNEIYALVLDQADPVVLCNFGGDQNHLGERTSSTHHAPKMKNEWARSNKAKVAPVGHKRSLKGRGHTYVVGYKWVEVPSNVALLCVNKKIHKEAVPVLYGATKFRFTHSNTMQRFLNSIGNNIQYLRDIGISAGGWYFRNTFRGARFEALAAAKRIHTFEVAHFDVCPNAVAQKRWSRVPGTDKVVTLCRPLLDSLKIAHKNNDLKASILEVIKINSVGSHESRDCGCTTKQVLEANIELQRILKQSIAEQHELEFKS